jgi:hypothetical protein
MMEDSSESLLPRANHRPETHRLRSFHHDYDTTDIQTNAWQ